MSGEAKLKGCDVKVDAGPTLLDELKAPEDAADTEIEALGIVTRAPMGERPISQRFPIYCAEEIHVEDLLRALSPHGFVLRGGPDGSWLMDQPRVFDLVKKEGE